MLILFIYIAFICAVDCFALISGYVYSCDNFKIKRLLNFWFQIIFYSFIISCILFAFGYSPTSDLKILLSNLFPIINKKYWFATDYFIVMLVMPLIISIFKKFNIFNSKHIILYFVLIYFLIVSLLPNELNGGYSALWLGYLYLLGHEIRTKFANVGLNRKIIILLILVTLFIGYGGKFVYVDYSFTEYVSINIVLFSVFLLLFFAKCLPNIKASKITHYVFGVYLFQNSEMVWDILGHSFEFVTNLNVFFGLSVVFISSFLLFAVGIFVEKFRIYLYQKTRISDLIDYLSNKANYVVNKIKCSIIK